MRVQFTCNQEEVVDAMLRVSKRSKVIRRLRRIRSLAVAFVAVLFVLVLFGFSIKGFIVAVVAALLSLITDPWLYRYEERKNTRKLIKERFGEQNQFTCEVELLPQTLNTNTSGVELNIPWESIEAIVETSDSVDFFGRQGFCMVRNRAFTSGEERQRFVDLAQEYLNRAQVIRD